LCAGLHSDLVTSAVVADRRAKSVGSVEKVIARLWRIVAARVANAIVDGVMPVVIVIGVYSIPSAVVRFKRVMRPANTRISACDNNFLPGESLRPDVRRVRVSDSRFDCRRGSGLHRPLLCRAGLRK